jgi:gamma-D-glutamyl-L-lysine dipeptidyl-peptidase
MTADWTVTDPEGRVAAVGVAAAGLWTSPDAPRALDEVALADPPGLREWSAAQGPAERRQLWGRLETQLLLGEPVIIDETRPGWARVVAPWQPSRKDERGYPGWVPLRQLQPPSAPTGATVVITVPVTDIRAQPAAASAALVADASFATRLPCLDAQPGWLRVGLPADRAGWVSDQAATIIEAEPPLPTAEQLLDAGRQFLGLTYLAGGCHGLSLDCSGLTHLLYRRFGHIIARDAQDKVGVGSAVAIEDLQPGDLMFFAKPDTGDIYHCGICSGDPTTMLHVSQTDWACLDGPLTEIRRGHLLTGRRLRS